MLRSRLAVGLTLTASLIASGLLAAPPASAAPKCFGETATIVGTGGADELLGTANRDVVVAFGGKDVIRGFAGKDLLCGGAGADDIGGGGGGDKMRGAGDDDTMGGQGGLDVVVGGGGNDVLFGGPVRDIVRGGKGMDFLFGNQGDDTLLGGRGFDNLLGQQGDDVFNGGAGDDVASFFFSRGPGGITANLETDIAIATGEGTDTLTKVNGLEGSGQVDASDEFTGGAGHNFFLPHGGNDVVDGRGGDDLILFPEAPTGVNVDLEAGTATGDGTDTLISLEMAAGSDFGDTISGTSGPNELYGVKGRDNIMALDGDDLLFGGLGVDTGDGGLGDDGCVSIEVPTSCETQIAAPAGAVAASPRLPEPLLSRSALPRSARPAY